ncbi:hypothetical protein Pcar_3123 [Syntrophotalea carbinolica DSM 2380]|uniref:Putative zinc-finger domain-containing protein n=1 Tax=Syntrophotalea carbinolica (strain DSM 2380 / NBRC 103641 / GraBd1) TaxID=338963 RepID=Q39ZU9_SYNC1|nr:zf-HC2 domain-containing protein [Syntrophotalea carbinolica]ABA90358.1 hypothetical protein Pcar_3123 [Syntrophotalea carbinolica DSM 2380]
MKRQATCNEKELVLFYYGELDAAGRQRLQSHLADCPACRSRLDALQRSLDHLSMPGVTLSEIEKTRLTAVITEKASQRAKPQRWLLGSAAAAVATLAISLMILPGNFARWTGQLPQSETEIGMLQDMELLQNIDLLENLDLLQDFERIG